MTLAEQASATIALVTTGSAILRPRIGRLTLGPVMSAVLGAAATVLSGLVDLRQVMEVVALLIFPVITIVSLMTITLVAEKVGLMDLASSALTSKADGDGRKLFLYLFVIGAFFGSIFTNDAAILIFTPLVFAILQRVKSDDWQIRNQIPYYFAVLYVGNVVGLFVISNPINIVVTSVFKITFFEYAAWMVLPALSSFWISYIGLKLYFRKDIPARIHMVQDQALRRTAPREKKPLVTVGIILAATVLGFFAEGITGVGVWAVALIGAAASLILLVSRGEDPISIVKGIGWEVVVFVFGIFIVVIGLKNQGFAQHMANLVQWVDHQTFLNEAFSAGFVSATSSAIFNNHPTSGIMIYVIDQLARPELEEKIMVFSALIGGDLGPKMLPIGSLAALMWFKMMRDRKIEVSYVTYIKLGIPITLTSVAVALAVLHAELYVYTIFNP